ncbi:hypothetical protein D0A34_09590 [Microcoleus vaginatus PCC 9802]|uniref:hypothetical protein n=1 Tax=Microcoleus vaginatus TaxID=119532 RepID=UPI00020D1AF0|nr:hypothetical protein MicvaDRAFT_4827 [Microcoleus vaginatus FGP-2]UNU19088.1 hypothetical protein D0A34_09590 [Microcoleus vaginatus PCC 9802]
MNVRDLIEIIGISIGCAGAVATGAFTVATLRAESNMKDVRNEIKEWNRFAQKSIQNDNHTMVELGLLKNAVNDIFRVLDMRRKPSLPEENKPQHTDF